MILDVFLNENFGCEIIRIKEKEFLEDVNNQTNIVCNKINEVIDKIKNKYGK
jgi:hypothetical protein